MREIKIHILDDKHPDYAICGDTVEVYDGGISDWRDRFIVFHQCQNCALVFAGLAKKS